MQLNDATLRKAVEAFYARVRDDSLLSPVFAVVGDWDEHFTRLTEFWSSLMLSSGKYKGNPIAMHVLHAERFQPGMFERWLTLWASVTTEMFEPLDASVLQAKAARIASRLNQAITGEQRPFGPHFAERRQLRPYRKTPEFTHSTVPRSLLDGRISAPGCWSSVTITNGELTLHVGTRRELLTPPLPGLVNPETNYRVEVHGPVSFHIELFDHPPQHMA